MRSGLSRRRCAWCSRWWWRWRIGWGKGNKEITPLRRQRVWVLIQREIIPTQLSIKLKLIQITVTYKIDLSRYHNLYHAEIFFIFLLIYVH
jgi:hypothetical protein